MKYPCKLCLIKACCSQYCNNWFVYINSMADNFSLLSSDEIHEFKIDTPLVAKQVIESFIKHNRRYAKTDKIDEAPYGIYVVNKTNKNVIRDEV